MADPRFGRSEREYTDMADRQSYGLANLQQRMENRTTADIGPVGRGPLTRGEIAENRWNAMPAGVYDMSGQGRTWFPSIDEKDRPFAYDRRHTPAGGPILTRGQISENRWNAMPAGVYDMSGQGRTWFPSIDEEDRPFPYDSSLTPAGGPILTRGQISENIWNAMPEGNIYDMSPEQDYFGPRNEEYEDFPPWWDQPLAGMDDSLQSLIQQMEELDPDHPNYDDRLELLQSDMDMNYPWA
jgi:hypothetical protein